MLIPLEFRYLKKRLKKIEILDNLLTRIHFFDKVKVHKKRWNGDLLEHYFTNNENLRSELRTISYEREGISFTFFSDLGVFSKDHIDYGSRVLVDSVLKSEKNPISILDVGCGYGYIGITLSKLLNSYVVMSDVNKRAVHLCERNIIENKVNAQVLVSDRYENVKGNFDIIVTNPPIRAGKVVVLSLLKEAMTYLNSDGRLYYVIRKDQGVKSIIKDLSEVYKQEVIKKDKGFYVVRAKRVDTT